MRSSWRDVFHTAAAALAVGCCLAVPSMGDMEIWAGVNGSGTNDASLPFKDMIWQSDAWIWAQSSDSGNTRRGHFGGVDRYPWPYHGVPKEVKLNAPLDENNFPTQVPFNYNGVNYRPVMLFNWFLPLRVYPYGTWTLIAEGKGRIDLGWDIDTTFLLTGGRQVFHFDINEIPPINILPETLNHFNALAGEKTSGLVLTIVQSDPNDHVRNIHMIRPDLNGGTSWVDNFETCPFNPQWFEDHRLFKNLRFMDWNNVNSSGIVHWEDRITPTRLRANDHLLEEAPYTNGGWIDANHIPYEFQIHAVNVLECDYWLTVPARANEDYVRNLAQLCKDLLKPNITVYVEWANETWNTMFVGLHSTDFVRDNYNSNVSDLFEAHAYMATRNTRIFREVLGADRVVGIVSGQMGNSGVGSNIIDALGRSHVNPHNVAMDAYAVTGYFGTTGRNPNHSSAAKANANRLNAKLLMYEGGTEGGRNPGPMYDLYRRTLDDFNSDGFVNFNAFVAVAGWMDVFGDWGHMQYVNQPLEDAFKYRAMWDYAVGKGQFDPNAPVPTCDGGPFVRDRAAGPVLRTVAPVRSATSVQQYNLQGKRTLPGTSTTAGVVVERSVQQVAPRVNLP